MSDPKKAKAAPKGNPKAKAVSTKTPKKAKVDTKRFLNLGDDLVLSFGKVKIYEVPVFEMLDVVGPSIELFQALVTTDELEMLKAIIASKELREKVCELFAIFCREDNIEQFKKCTITDLKQLVLAIKEIINIDDAKELFLALGAQNLLTLTSTA